MKKNGKGQKKATQEMASEQTPAAENQIQPAKSSAEERGLEKSMIDRLLQTYLIIKQGNFPSATLIGQLVGAKRRVVCEDIAFLRDRMNKPIEFDPVKNGWYFTEPDGDFSGLWGIQPDLWDLCVMGKAMDIFPGTTFNAALKEVYDKTVAELSEEDRQSLELWRDQIVIQPFGVDVVDAKAFDLILTGLRGHRVVKYPYRKPGQKDFEMRTVHPWAVTQWRGAWYLVGYCERAKEERTFHLSRLRDPQLTEERYTIPETFNAKEHFKKCFGVQKGTGNYKVVVQLNPIGADIYRPRNWHVSQQWVDLEDGCARVSFDLTSLVEIKYTILGWGKDATVIQPPELIKDMIDELDRMRANYVEKVEVLKLAA